MILDLRQIPDDGERFDVEMRLGNLLDEAGEPLLDGVVRLWGEARPEAGGIGLRATLEARIRQPCSRCLEPTRTGLVTEIFLTLVGEGAEFGPAEARMDPADASLCYTRGGKADLAEIAAEQIYLNLPLKPVCRDACAGLCSTCGGNRNRIECGCRTEPVDPRLAPLLALKERLNRG